MYRPISLLLIFCALLSVFPLAMGDESPMNNRYQDGVILTIRSKPFDAKQHIIKKCDGAVCIIDGKFIYGGNGNIPKEEVASLVFEKQGKKIALDVSSMYDTGVNNANIKQYVTVTSWGTKSYRVTGYFSDGDDTYIGQWLVLPDGAIRNYIGDYEALVSLTTKVQEDYKLPGTTYPNTNQ